MISRVFIAATALTTAIASTPEEVGAQTRCEPRSVMIENLERRYNETGRPIGLTRSGQGFMEVYGSDDRGTWTITQTNAEGLTCIMASGNAFFGHDASVENVLKIDGPYQQRIEGSIVVGEYNSDLRKNGHFKTPPENNDYEIVLTGQEPGV